MAFFSVRVRGGEVELLDRFAYHKNALAYATEEIDWDSEDGGVVEADSEPEARARAKAVFG